MSRELKPCPFCGGKANLLSYRASEDAMGCFIRCVSCLVQTTEYEDAYTPSDDAIAAWNTRAALSAPPAPAPIEAEAVAAELEHKANDYSQMLKKPGFRPSRDMLEDCRNAMRRAIAALRAPAPAAEPSRFKSPLADAVAKKVHNEMASLRSVTGVTIDTVAQEYRIVCDGFPSHEGPRFIEVEDETGKSIKAGEWRKRNDGYCELVIRAPATAARMDAEREEGWTYKIQYGPDGEANYAWVYRGKEMVATMQTHFAVLVCTEMNAAALDRAALSDGGRDG